VVRNSSRQRHDGRDAAILRHREQVYDEVRQRHPERWPWATRNWKLEEEVWLNPEKDQLEILKQAA
jgi:putative transposase